MSDEPVLLARKVLGSLRPASKATEDAFQALDDKPVRIRLTRTNGNTRRFALYWSCLALAAPMLSERIEGDALSTDLLHKILKKRAGLVRVVTLPSGDTVEDYESTSFTKMAEPERAAFIDWALTTLAKWLGVKVEDLLREGQS